MNWTGYASNWDCRSRNDTRWADWQGAKTTFLEELAS
jgi:hypothetical protein